MKFTRNTIVTVLAAFALAAGWRAFAQTNKPPGPTEYPSFAHFITDRNIFDPNRQPHYSSGRTQRTRTRTRVSPSAPSFTFVGTMSYTKGMFAFFNGNSEELKQALQVSGKIADYKVTEITSNRVKLESADKKQALELKIGDLMRQENGKWELSKGSELPDEPISPDTTVSPGGESATGTDATPAAAPTSANEPNDVLKRLMQLREKENQ